MSKDLEDSTEKLLGSQRKGSQLNAAKESKDRTSSKDPRSKTLKPISTSIVNHSSPSKPRYLLTWFGTFLPLDEWLDTNQAQRNGLKCKKPKISSKWSKAKEKSRRITRNETNQSQKSVPKDMGNGSTQPINKAWPLKKEAGLNTIMQWQSTVPPERGKGSTQPMREHAKPQTPQNAQPLTICTTPQECSTQSVNSPWINAQPECLLPLKACYAMNAVQRVYVKHSGIQRYDHLVTGMCAS